jgi:hypothetical protein
MLDTECQEKEWVCFCFSFMFAVNARLLTSFPTFTSLPGTTTYQSFTIFRSISDALMISHQATGKQRAASSRHAPPSHPEHARLSRPRQDHKDRSAVEVFSDPPRSRPVHIGSWKTAGKPILPQPPRQPTPRLPRPTRNLARKREDSCPPYVRSNERWKE